jgi:hypothetical protein
MTTNWFLCNGQSYDFYGKSYLVFLWAIPLAWAANLLPAADLRSESLSAPICFIVPLVPL